MYKVADDNYNRIEAKLELEKLRVEYVPDRFKSIDLEKSYYEVTDFGRNFINAVTE